MHANRLLVACTFTVVPQRMRVCMLFDTASVDYDRMGV